MSPLRRPDVRGERGQATLIAVLALLLIGGLVGLVLTVSQRHAGEIKALADANRAFFAAQSGLNDALARLEAGTVALEEEGDELWVGTADAPLEVQGGTARVHVARTTDTLFTLTARARAGLQEQAIEVVVRRSEEGVYRNGIFAGNSSGDPGYQLELGGRLAQADQVFGDVYSGGGVAVSGDAEVIGTIRAMEGVTGKGAASAEIGKKQAIPDIAGMDYARTADIDVAAEFAGGSPTYRSNAAGGSAWQLAESNPAHIFRKNPSDRTAEINGTVKDDYFLEDPYEPVRADSGSDGSNAYPLTLSGVSGESGKSSNQKVFFVDGNLWIHNYQTMSLKFAHADASGVQVTFVVKGNIYISDNLFYSDNAKDGVAFIAMKDKAVADSGNIYFGDPVFGTLEQMHAFMYAENNFIDNNLSATGSAQVAVYGNMTAGNQVQIQRDYGSQHSKLTVNYDGRISAGSLMMPGLPRANPDEDGQWTYQATRRIARP
jgi:Tfp pilus assembly protein PilX